eukprot:2676226-Rhodomonas_salina.2
MNADMHMVLPYPTSYAISYALTGTDLVHMVLPYAISYAMSYAVPGTDLNAYGTALRYLLRSFQY